MTTQGGWVVVGLGNPGDEYVGSRHNTGRELLMAIAKKEMGKVDDPLTRGALFGKKVSVLVPNSYMNNSGGPIKKLVASAKAAQNLVVIHDELDLPLGAVKLSFGAGAGGHNGVASIQKALKTKDFIRVRVGISPATPSGKLKRPDAKKIVDFVLGKFRALEIEKLKKSRKTVSEALELILTEGKDRAMNEINTRS